jgi:hypothetical protein
MANAPETRTPQSSPPPTTPKQPTTSDTAIDPMPATRLPMAWPEKVGGTDWIATPNSVPGTASTRTGPPRTVGRGGPATNPAGGPACPGCGGAA